MFKNSDAKLAIDLIRHEWDIPVLVSLATCGPMRHKQLMQAIAVSDRMLTQTLKRLVTAQLVSREVTEGEWPAAIMYVLSPLAQELMSALEPLAEWGRRYRRLAAGATPDCDQ